MFCPCLLQLADSLGLSELMFLNGGIVLSVRSFVPHLVSLFGAGNEFLRAAKFGRPEVGRIRQGRGHGQRPRLELWPGSRLLERFEVEEIVYRQSASEKPV